MARPVGYRKGNVIELCGDHVAFIVNSKRHGTIRILCDVEDARTLSKYTWSAVKKGRTFYAHTKVPTGDKEVTLYMHHVMCPVGIGSVVDHISGDGLDNRRKNLRATTPGKNCHNKIKRTNNTSGFVGVSMHKASGKWRAVIGSNGRQSSLGLFENALDAARAYDLAVIERDGSDVTERSLNFSLSDYFKEAA